MEENRSENHQLRAQRQSTKEWQLLPSVLDTGTEDPGHELMLLSV